MLTTSKLKHFAIWRTKLWRSERERSRLFFEGEFRLPNEMQWEWAARGGRNQSPYPWGGPYLVTKRLLSGQL